MVDQLLNHLAPYHCCGCGSVGSLLCARCNEDIVASPLLLCLSCTKRQATSNGLCRLCRPPYSRGWAAGVDDGALEKLLRDFKFGPARAAATVLAELMVVRLPDLPSNCVLVPLPTIQRHIRERGFDHTKLLVKALAATKQIEYDTSLLSRRTQVMQRGQSAVVRQKQAALAYSVKGEVSSEKIYLLLDDVMTTGASLFHAAKALRKHGARQVWAAVVARHVGED